MSRRAFYVSLIAVLVLALGGFAAVIATRDQEARSDLWSEVGKGMIQLVVVVFVGGVLKLVADAYQARSAEAQRHDEFRRDKHQRLVAATATLRKVPVLIEANRSVKTWSAEMLAAIDMGNELRAIKHEIVASNSADPPPFGDHGHTLVSVLGEMVDYIDDRLTADFRDAMSEFDELQREAEAESSPVDERRRLKEEIWKKLTKLPSVADMYEDRSDGPWRKYFDDYQTALDLMTRASLASRGRLRRRT